MAADIIEKMKDLWRSKQEQDLVPILKEDNKKHYYMVKYGEKKGELKTFIRLDLLQDCIKEVKSDKWTFNKKDEMEIKDGKIILKNGIKEFYYRNNKIITLNRDQEQYINVVKNKFIKNMQYYKKDLLYLWTLECSNKLHLNVLVNIEYSEEFANWVRRRWSELVELKFEDFCTDTSSIRELDKAIEYMFKGPVYSGIAMKFKIDFGFFDKIDFQNNINYLYNNKANYFNKQLEMEQFNVIKTQSRCKDLHFYYVIKPLVKDFYMEFVEALLKLRSTFKVKGLYFIENILDLNKYRVYKILANILNLYYITAQHSIIRSRLSFCEQLSLIVYYFGKGKGYKVEKFDVTKKELLDKFELYFKDKKNLIKFGFELFNIFNFGFMSKIYNVEVVQFKEKECIKIELKQDIIDKYRMKGEKKHLYGVGPMIVEPKDWKVDSNWASLNTTGGFLLNNIKFFLPLSKGVYHEEFKYVRDVKYPKGNFIRALNFCQKIPYEVNVTQLNYIEKILDKIFKFYYKEIWTKERIDELVLNFKESKRNFEQREILNQAKSNFSKMQQIRREINVCKEFYKYEKLFFVYNVDFRGRIYVKSDILNYQASKLIRGCLRYYNKVKIDLKNSFWFKVQCVKYYLGSLGHTAEELVNFFDKVLLNKIENWNFDDETFWLASNEPWLFLGCLVEYKQFEVYGKDYMSGLMMWLDASCSGSQLISLLLGIDKYSKELNLVKSSKEDKPGDYYMVIINEFMSNLVEKDTKETRKILKNLQFIDNKLLRKFFKKIIMTINYGLTPIGMLSKFKEINMELNLKLKNDVLKLLKNEFYEFIQNLSLYKSLDKLQEIVKFLADIDNILQFRSSIYGLNMEKEYDMISSPAYFAYKDLILNHTFSFGKRYRKRMSVRIFDKNQLNKEEYVRAIKANLIHHLDSLWVYSFLYKCYEKNILDNIAIVHDCYSTDLVSVEQMNLVLRETLIELFRDENLLWKFLHKTLSVVIGLKEEDYSKLNLLLITKEQQNKVISELKDSLYLLFP
jgi:DNA-dependent RNA polymerase